LPLPEQVPIPEETLQDFVSVSLETVEEFRRRDRAAEEKINRQIASYQRGYCE
jgi:hypothetical protein